MHATQIQIDYKQLLSRLCHLVALSEAKKIEGVAESLILSVMESDAANPATDRPQIEAALVRCYGVRLDPTDFEASISRLIQRGALVSEHGAGGLLLSPKSRAEQQQRLADANALEQKVKVQWCESLKTSFQTWNDQIADELWECLQLYLTRLFRRHGAQAALVASGQRFEDAELDTSIGDILTNAISEGCRTIDKAAARAALDAFFKEQTPEKARYIAQLLDGTFSFYTLFTDEATQAYLKRAIPQITVFLDTNFLFGVLGLHDNPQNEVSVELVTIVRDQKLPFELYYHEDSLHEMRDTIDAIEKHLSRFMWSTALSRAVLQTRAYLLSGLELKFHEANAKSQIEPGVFFLKYRYVEKLLNAQGFKIYRRPQKLDLDKLDQKTTEMISHYKRYLEEHHKEKKFSQVRHDILVWQTAKGLRKSHATGLDVGALLLSADQRFFAYDWGVLSSGSGLGVVVLPSQLLQLLRPFVPRTIDFDKRFAEVFSLPGFRAGDFDFSRVIQRVLQFLATVKDIGEETAAAILADELLMRRLRNVESEEEIKVAVESEILKKNAELAEQNKAVSAKLEAAQAEAAQKQSLLEAAQRDAAGHARTASERAAELERERLEKEKSVAAAAAAENATAQIRQELQTAREEKEMLDGSLQAKLATVSGLQTKLSAIEATKSRNRKKWRCIGGTIFAVAGWAVLLWLPAIQNWPWLQNHHQKISLYLAGFLLVAGLSWSIFAWKHRAWAVSAVILAVIIKLIGIL
jgi:flagellar biosynthesis GTPase FlhF